MSINEDVTDGKIHLGVLQGTKTNVANLNSMSTSPIGDADGSFINPTLGAPGTRGEAWRNPAIEIDEDYWGKYHLEKNISLEVPYQVVSTAEDWLPCCFGGWSDMNYFDQKGMRSAKGIFDCTCFKTQKTAQFPEPTEAKAW